MTTTPEEAQEAWKQHFENPYCKPDEHEHDCACGAYEEGAEKAITDFKSSLRKSIEERRKHWKDLSDPKMYECDYILELLDTCKPL